MRPCPFCAEQIQEAAVLCRFCGRAVSKVAPETEPHEQGGATPEASSTIARPSRPALLGLSSGRRLVVALILVASGAIIPAFGDVGFVLGPVLALAGLVLALRARVVVRVALGTALLGPVILPGMLIGYVNYAQHQNTLRKLARVERDLRSARTEGNRREVTTPAGLDTRETRQQAIVCNRFKIVHSRSGDTLTVSLDSDLPADVLVKVIVRRSYIEKGDQLEFSEDYLNESDTAGALRKGREISIAHAIFKRELAGVQSVAAGGGIAYVADKISPDVLVWLRVDDDQKGKTPNLTGSAVTLKGSTPVVEAKALVPYPIGEVPAPSRLPVNPDRLVVGKTYRVSRPTAMMPDADYSDPLLAIEGREFIPAEATFTVKAFAQNSNPWYRVESRSGVGRVYVTALLGQQLLQVEGEDE